MLVEGAGVRCEEEIAQSREQMLTFGGIWEDSEASRPAGEQDLEALGAHAEGSICPAQASSCG